MENNIGLPKFQWWMGIVEDRIDPAETGRVRVRIFGYHSSSTEDLPTSELPYATIMNPVTSSGMNGIMEMPNIVKGSTVVGFFTDEDAQVPVIMGTIAGIPTERNFPAGQGFVDPAKKYPKEPDSPTKGYSGIGESDIPRLARGEDAESHASLMNLREMRDEGIPIAKSQTIVGILDDKQGFIYEEGERPTWDEPHPRGKSKEEAKYFNLQQDLQDGGQGTPKGDETSLYPFNLVKETELGIVQELDNTPGNVRIHEFHPSGTNREIQNDGSRICNVAGSDYEIIVKDKNVFVRGSANVTILGDAKLLIKGSKIEEIEKDYHLAVGGDFINSISGSHVMNIGTDQHSNISGSRHAHIQSGMPTENPGGDYETIKGNQTTLVGMTQNIKVGGARDDMVGGKANLSIGGSLTETIGFGKKKGEPIGGARLTTVRDNFKVTQTDATDPKGNINEVTIASKAKQTYDTELSQHLKSLTEQTIIVGTTQDTTVTGQQTITAENTDIMNDVDITGTSTTTVDHVSNGISGHDHTHAQTGGTGDDGDSGVDTAAPTEPEEE